MIDQKALKCALKGTGGGLVRVSKFIVISSALFIGMMGLVYVGECATEYIVSKYPQLGNTYTIVITSEMARTIFGAFVILLILYMIFHDVKVRYDNYIVNKRNNYEEDLENC
jgi:hypothetical protein